MTCYLVAEADVHNQDLYQEYAKVAGPLVTRYGGRFLARAGETHSIEGTPPANRIMIMEFPSVEAAKNYRSCPEHHAVTGTQREACSSLRVYAVEGYTGS